ncbi:mCG146040, partial [Mus musculus]
NLHPFGAEKIAYICQSSKLCPILLLQNPLPPSRQLQVAPNVGPEHGRNNWGKTLSWWSSKDGIWHDAPTMTFSLNAHSGKQDQGAMDSSFQKQKIIFEGTLWSGVIQS